MRRRLNAMLFVLIAFVATFWSCTNEVAGDGRSEPQQTSQNTNEVAADFQEAANNANEEILSRISKKTRNSDSPDKYPDYYGGSFVGKDGSLTVYVKGDSATAARKIKAVNNSKVVKFKKARYSYKDLEKIMDYIEYNLPKASRSITQNVSGYALSDLDNRVEIYLIDCSKEKIAEFKTFYNHPALIFGSMSRIVPKIMHQTDSAT